MSKSTNKIVAFFTGYILVYNSGKLALYVDELGDLVSNIHRAKIFDLFTALLLKDALGKEKIEVVVAELNTSYVIE